MGSPPLDLKDVVNGAPADHDVERGSLGLGRRLGHGGLPITLVTLAHAKRITERVFVCRKSLIDNCLGML